MRRAARLLAVVGALVLFVPAPALLPALWGSGACASAAGAGHAALIVGTGTQTLRMCVTLDSASVTGLHLIELAHAQHGLQYRLGFGGLAVCQLAGVGPTVTDCFASYPAFWGLWLGDGSGGWTWSGSGAGSIHVADGDIQAWTWGPGDSGSSHPMPPRTNEVSVCGASVPSPAPASRTSTPTAAPSPRNAASATDSARPSRAASRTPGAPTAAVQPDPSADAALVAGAGPGGPSGAGLSAGIPLAVGGVLALGLAGWMRTRRSARMRDVS